MKLTVAEWICYINKRVTALEDRTPSACSLLYGENSPGQLLGSNGDLYLCFQDGSLHKKVSGAWEEQGKIALGLVDGGEF